MFEQIITYIVDLVSQLGYLGIILLMALESSCFPFPSEVVMIPAGYLSSLHEMNISLVIFSGIFGSLLGALFNYYLAKYLGKPLLHKYGKYFFINEDKLNQAEKFFKAHGSISTFIGRLIPLIRQYISIPAGISHMNIIKFSFYTSLGASIWVTILVLLGYYIGENEELISLYKEQIMIGILVFCIIVISVYITYNKEK